MAVAAVIAAIVGGVAWTIATSRDLQWNDSFQADSTRPVGADGPLRPCVVCHSIERSEPLRVGPPLYGIVGAPKARTSWYGYSPALAKAGGVWSEKALNQFLTAPRKYLPGTAMTFDGIQDARERAAVIAALRAGY
jgi:cytochrome c